MNIRVAMQQPISATTAATLCRRAVSVRPSGCLSRSRIVSKRVNIFSNFFSPSGRHTSLVFAHQTLWQYSDGDLPDGDVECRGYEKISRFIPEMIPERAIVTMKRQ